MGLFCIFFYLVILYIRPQDWMAGFVGLPLMDLAACLGLMVGLLTVLSRRQNRSLALPQNWLLVAFLLLTVVSNLAHGQVAEATSQFMIYLKRLTPFVILLLLVNSPRRLKWTMVFVILLSTYLAVQSIAQSATGVGWAGQEMLTMQMRDEAFRRVTWVGMWDGPNVLSLLFVLAMPFAVEFALGKYNVIVRLVSLWVAGVLLYGIVLANSRGSFLAMTGVLFFYLIQRFRAVRGVALSVIALPVIWVTLAPSRMAFLTTRDSSSSERSWLWEQGLNMLQANPIFGVGKGQFVEHSWGQMIAHNNFVSNMAEMGLPGLFVYVAIIYFSFKGLLMAQRALQGVKREWLLASLSRALFASLIGYNIATFFINMELEILFLWWGLCAAAAAIAQQRTGRPALAFTRADALYIGLGMAAVIMVVYLIAVKEIV